MSSKYEALLINMPFSYLQAPSIGLGLLKSALTRQGISCRILHLDIRFAELIGLDDYLAVLYGTFAENLAGEWIFSDSLFPENQPRELEYYVNEILRTSPLGPHHSVKYEDSALKRIAKTVSRARDQVGGFLEESVEIISKHQPRVIGFTSVFHQHVASLSLAQRVKAGLPDSFIVFGGANCEGVMGKETLNQFNFVDAVVSGEGDHVFPALVQRILAGKPVMNEDGVLTRNGSKRMLGQQMLPVNAPLVRDLDSLPIPDYDDYFQQLAESSIEFRSKPGLLFETSRGCWWGEKHHCTFCGLNGGNMKFRSKSAKRALDELVYLTKRHPGCAVNVVDNILDMDYFKDFVPMLARSEQKLHLFYEVKANLKKDQLCLLRNAGILSIQPGIESFSDHVLAIMRKGVSGLQNVQLLKWCREIGLTAYYNLIWGFPGENVADYQEMANLIPLISHLQPPVAASTIRIDRFSPNFDQSAQLGFSSVSPHPAYGHVYPLNAEIVSNLAYFFTFEYSEKRDVASYVMPVAQAVDSWKANYQKSNLFWMEKDENLLIWDTRSCAKRPLFVMSGLRKFCYLACDQIMTPRQVLNLWKRGGNQPLNETDIADALDEITTLGLMLKSENSYLALAHVVTPKDRETKRSNA
jgi:ribosomal peptide maturation radical SAM protein 1